MKKTPRAYFYTFFCDFRILNFDAMHTVLKTFTKPRQSARGSGQAVLTDFLNFDNTLEWF